MIYADRDPGKDGARKLQAEWVEARRGNRKPAVLSGARFEPLTVKPEESQFLGTIDANVHAVARLFGCPGDDRRHHRRAAGLHLPGDALARPVDLHGQGVAGRLENALSALLPSTQVARFNAAGMVRVDLKSRYEAHEIAPRAGFLTINEVRALEDRGPLPDEPGGAVA